VFNLDTGILSISSVQVGTTTYNDVDVTIQNVISLESFASVANNITQRVEILPPSGYDLLPFMVQGRFKETGVNYVLVAGWLNKGNCWLNTNGVLTQICETANPDAPVKVFSAAQDLAPNITYAKLFAYIFIGLAALAVNLVGLSVIYLNISQWVLRKGGTDTAWFWFNSEPKGLMAVRERLNKD